MVASDNHGGAIVEMGSIRVMLPQLMAENGDSVSDLARELNVSWETAKRKSMGESSLTAGELAKLCERYGVQPGEIFVYRPDTAGAEA
jgi:DNA-binding Xre family transcriptional regulator